MYKKYLQLILSFVKTRILLYDEYVVRFSFRTHFKAHVV